MICFNYMEGHFWWVGTTNTMYYILFKFMQRITKNGGVVGFVLGTPPTTNILIIMSHPCQPTTLFINSIQTKLFKHMKFDPREKEEHRCRVQHKDWEGFRVGTYLEEYYGEYSKNIWTVVAQNLRRRWQSNTSSSLYSFFSKLSKESTSAVIIWTLAEIWALMEEAHMCH